MRPSIRDAQFPDVYLSHPVLHREAVAGLARKCAKGFEPLSERGLVHFMRFRSLIWPLETVHYANPSLLSFNQSLENLTILLSS